MGTKIENLSPDLLAPISRLLPFSAVANLAISSGDNALRLKCTTFGGVKEVVAKDEASIARLCLNWPFVTSCSGLTHLVIKIDLNFKLPRGCLASLPLTMLEINIIGCEAADVLLPPLGSDLDKSSNGKIGAIDGVTPIAMDQLFPTLQSLVVKSAPAQPPLAFDLDYFMLHLPTSLTKFRLSCPHVNMFRPPGAALGLNQLPNLQEFGINLDTTDSAFLLSDYVLSTPPSDESDDLEADVLMHQAIPLSSLRVLRGIRLGDLSPPLEGAILKYMMSLHTLSIHSCFESLEPGLLPPSLRCLKIKCVEDLLIDISAVCEPLPNLTHLKIDSPFTLCMEPLVALPSGLTRLEIRGDFVQIEEPLPVALTYLVLDCEYWEADFSYLVNLTHLSCPRGESYTGYNIPKLPPSLKTLHLPALDYSALADLAQNPPSFTIYDCKIVLGANELAFGGPDKNYSEAGLLSAALSHLHPLHFVNPSIGHSEAFQRQLLEPDVLANATQVDLVWLQSKPPSKLPPQASSLTHFKADVKSDTKILLPNLSPNLVELTLLSDVRIYSTKAGFHLPKEYITALVDATKDLLPPAATPDNVDFNCDHTGSVVHINGILHDPQCALPPSLEKLHLDFPVVVKHGSEDGAALGFYPDPHTAPRLHTLHFRLDRMKPDHFIAIKNLPTTITDLTLDLTPGLWERIDYDMAPPSAPESPWLPNLRRLTVHSSPFPLRLVYDRLNQLEHLLLDEVAIHSDLLRFHEKLETVDATSLWRQCLNLIPGRHRRLEMTFVIDWTDVLLSKMPPTLKALELAFSANSSSFSFSALPRRLTRLDLSSYVGTYSTDGLHSSLPPLRSIALRLQEKHPLLPLAHLASLTSVSIRSRQVPILSILRILPPSLEQLVLTADEEMGPEEVALLPRSLTHLVLLTPVPLSVQKFLPFLPTSLVTAIVGDKNTFADVSADDLREMFPALKTITLLRSFFNLRPV